MILIIFFLWSCEKKINLKYFMLKITCSFTFKGNTLNFNSSLVFKNRI